MLQRAFKMSLKLDNTLERGANILPLLISFHFNSNILEKITLAENGRFSFTFVGICNSKELIKDWFSDFLKGNHLPFPLPLHGEKTSFSSKVLDQLKKIPFGKTLSYGEIAKNLGNPNAARAVGNACNKNPFPLVIPCHRVISSDGSLGGFAYGCKMKRTLLNFEQTL